MEGMTAFIYRWKIPYAMQSEFVQNWKELTEQVKADYGMRSAELLQFNQEFVSVTHWPTFEAWDKWKSELSDHPYRIKWREYKIGELQMLTPVATV